MRAHTARESDAARIASLRPRVARWFAREQRDLPWRRRHDGYAVWVSEVMLQQTRVEVVVPYFERFLSRFPTVGMLAAASEDEVLQAWAGLGYYARARNLRAAAGIVVTEHAGLLPRTVDALCHLPGVGRYTAGAIASIAFAEPAPILDGNVARVFARWFRIEDEVQAPPVQRRLWALAELWARTPAPGRANEALMELGALVCTKPVPACTRCPVRSGCAAHATGRVEAIPRPRRRPETRRVALDLLLATHGSRVLLVRRTAGTLLRGYWELPTAHGGPDAEAPPLAARAEERFGCRLRPVHRLGSVRHGILHHDLRVTLWRSTASGRTRAVRPLAGTARDQPGALANLDLERLEARWFAPEECRALPLATLARKALRAAARDARWKEFLAGRPQGDETP